MSYPVVAAHGGSGGDHPVDMIDFGFAPQNATIAVGDTVTWTNTGSFAHTTTSGTTTGGTRHPDGLWDSGSMLPGKSFSHVFAQAGTFPYYCTPHYTSMTGTVTVKAAANTPPRVSITSPADGATFPSPASVTIQATADDADGIVVKVGFFNGSGSVGTDTAVPYSQRVTLYPGTYVLTAVATDNAGVSTTSAPVTVTVNTTPIVDPIPAHIVKGDITIELQPVVDGLAAPLGLAVPDDGSKRMFVYDQAGLAWVATDGAGKLPTPLLDVRSRLVTFGNYDERGLLGLTDRPTGFWLRGFGEDADGELYALGSTVLGPKGDTGQMLKLVPSLPVTYQQHNLVSDVPGLADRVDPDLVNPWGIASGPTTPFWMADNHTSASSVYDGNGVQTRTAVAIAGAPTGIVFNATTDFAVAPGQPAKWLFATEDGTIAGWSSGGAAVTKVGGRLYVTYAVPDAARHDDVSGPGNGHGGRAVTARREARIAKAIGPSNAMDRVGGPFASLLSYRR